MKDTDIERIALEAAENAVNWKAGSRYFKDHYYGMSDEARTLMAKVYLMRHKSYADPAWIDVYKDWIKATDGRFKDGGINKMIALSKFFYEKIKLGKGDTIKKTADRRVKEFTHGIYR